MPDTPAARQARARKHKAGDHSLCTARCKGDKPTAADVAPSTPAPVALPDVPADETKGGIEASVEAYVEALSFDPGDPRAILGKIAVKLARRVDEGGALPAAVRELRVMLAQITEVPNGPAGGVDEVRMRRALRRLDVLLSAAS